MTLNCDLDLESADQDMSFAHYFKNAHLGEVY